MSTHNSMNKEQDRQAAEERFRRGTREYTEGRLEQAAISLGNAERFSSEPRQLTKEEQLSQNKYTSVSVRR